MHALSSVQKVFDISIAMIVRFSYFSRAIHPYALNPGAKTRFSERKLVYDHQGQMSNSKSTTI